MTATRGSYSLNCKTSIGTAHYSVICDNPAKISSTQNDNTGTAPGHVTRSATTLNVTSSHGELSATPNGTSNKLSNGQQCSTANGNGIIRSKTQANGRTCSSNGLSSDKRETLGNGSSDIKSSSTPLPSCGHELRSQQLSSARPVTNGSSAQSLTSSHCHRQNGTHNGSSCHVGGNATTEFFASPNSSRRYQGINGQVVEVTSSLAQNGHTSSLETTDIDGLQDIVDHPFFTLADDAGQHDSLQIVSSKGTVRGVRNRVKAGIAVFVEQQGNRKQKVSGLGMHRMYEY